MKPLFLVMKRFLILLYFDSNFVRYYEEKCNEWQSLFRLAIILYAMQIMKRVGLPQFLRKVCCLFVVQKKKYFKFAFALRE